MKKFTAIGIALLFVAGLIPLLWLRPGYIVGNGDNFPVFLNSETAISKATDMWSPDYLGYASPNPSYLLLNYVSVFFGYLGLDVGSIQILIQILLYMGAGFSMYFFSRTVYPNHKIAPFFASFFYMFNFFVLDSRFNLGFAWSYTFLPLVLALFVRIINATYISDKKSANTGIICFALVSVVALSVASINPANVALFLFALLVFGFYYLIKYRKCALPLILTIIKIAAVTVLLNIWWIYPMLNTFIFSPVALNSQVSVASWSWTHSRSSFLNLFWLNGTWGWFKEYVPFIDFYFNPIVQVLMFVPILFAGSALLFKSNKQRFNAYIMAAILVFLFLAKGIHEPFGQLNLALYEYVPLMSMFREPASKFTLLIIPFLALLFGYTTEGIANVKLNIKPETLKSRYYLRLFTRDWNRVAKVIILLFLSITLIFSSLPIFGKVVPFVADSSYIQIPQYWFNAASWINHQPGDWKVLLTPLDDYYQMNYTWGYYGSDQLLERFFDKPIVSTASLNGYLDNGVTSAVLAQVRSSEKFNRTNEFKSLLDLLSIKYIVQRNDVITDTYNVDHVVIPPVSGRNLKTSAEMKAFFSDQPYLKLVNSFGQLDIYEYMQAKPSINVLLPSTLNKTDIHIEQSSNKTWNLIDPEEVRNWSGIVSSPQETCYITQKNGQLIVDIWNSTNGIIVNSPFIQTDSGGRYQFNATISADNVHRVEVKIVEYSQNATLLEAWNLTEISWAFTSYDIVGSFEPRTENTKYIGFQISIVPLTNSTLRVENLSVYGSVSTLKMNGIENLYSDAENQSIQLTQVQRISQQKIIANVKSTQPFILATTQTLDRFWVAYVNGEVVSPTSLYLGLKGFMVNQTGQLQITVVYRPQDWFNYCLAISGATVLFLFFSLVYLNRQAIPEFIKKSKPRFEMYQ